MPRIPRDCHALPQLPEQFSAIRTAIAQGKNAHAAWQIAANNDDYNYFMAFDVPHTAPLEVLTKTYAFGKFDLQLPFSGKACKRRKFPCASDGTSCLACGMPALPRPFGRDNYFDRRIHFIMHGVLS